MQTELKVRVLLAYFVIGLIIGVALKNYLGTIVSYFYYFIYVLILFLLVYLFFLKEFIDPYLNKNKKEKEKNSFL